jgi:hypothetical protein
VKLLVACHIPNTRQFGVRIVYELEHRRKIGLRLQGKTKMDSRQMMELLLKEIRVGQEDFLARMYADSKACREKADADI